MRHLRLIIVDSTIINRKMGTPTINNREFPRLLIVGDAFYD